MLFGRWQVVEGHFELSFRFDIVCLCGLHDPVGFLSKRCAPHLDCDFGVVVTISIAGALGVTFCSLHGIFQQVLASWSLFKHSRVGV